MSGFDDAAAVLPGDLRKLTAEYAPELRECAREFRLRLGKPFTVLTGGCELILDKKRIVTASDLMRVVEIATDASPYAAAAGIEKGYVTASGGVRIGLCGQRHKKDRGSWVWTGLTSAAVPSHGK